ncbi:hypothetical protein PT974_11599 [Cladobotryum mycophilum]|uniref:Xylanolytic transcriptional activator regulatory domain-containing protein n=1 Tax=Cladobotryum mycophilum TaxID=491253 RepID=A0ABR0S6P6_9HYPO
MSVAKNAEGQEGIIEGLEREVARLEAQVSQIQSGGVVRVSPDLRSETQTHAAHGSISSLSAREESPETVDLNVLKEVETVSLYRGELYGLEKMTRRALQLDNSDPRGFLNYESRKSLISSSKNSRNSRHNGNESSLEKETTTRYADNFFSHIHPTFPVLDEPKIRHVLNLMLENRIPGTEEQIMAYLVLAMGAVLPSQSSVLDTVNSAEYFLRAAEVQFSYDESLKTAQILILFTIYSLFDPTTGSSWQLIDLVMQVCIVLGLHHLQVGAGGEKEEAEGVRIFKAAYTLDFFISSAMGLPMSTPNTDITFKCRAHSFDASQTLTSEIMDNILTPLGIYSWAYELSESPGNTAAAFLRAYDAYVLHDKSGRDDRTRKFMPSLLGFHLAIQSLRRLAPNEAITTSRNGLLIDHWQSIPKTMPSLLMLPWIAGYSAFQAALLQMTLCGRIPEKQPRLTQSLSQSNLILSVVSSKFKGLSPHAEFGSSVLIEIMSPAEGIRLDIDFLEGSDLYQFCAEALNSVGIGID